MDERDLIFFKDALGEFSVAELNESFVVNLVKDNYEKIDFKEYNAQKFVLSVSLLEYYLNHNFVTFTITEDIYRFAKHICEKKISLLNNWRSSVTHESFKEWLIRNKYIRKDGYFWS